jgi:hypothetical protein
MQATDDLQVMGTGSEGSDLLLLDGLDLGPMAADLVRPHGHSSTRMPPREGPTIWAQRSMPRASVSRRSTSTMSAKVINASACGECP